MTVAPVYATNTEVLVVSVEANADEYITSGANASKINESGDETEIDLEKEQNTEAYQETLNIDIGNIDKI